MANASAILYRIYELPWSTGVDDDRKFKQFAKGSLIAAVVFALVFAILPQPKIDPRDVPEVPKTLVKLVLERQQPPPPPPVVREEPKPEKVVEERKVEPPKPKPEPVVKPEPKPVDTTQQARDRAKVAGLLPLTNALQSLRDSKVADRLDRTDVGVVNSTAPFAERSLITSKVGTASGGINTAALSRNTGGSGLGSRNTTQVDSPVEAVAMAGGAAQRSGESGKAARSREEVERVFDTNKGRIFTLYNRALRENPALQGKVVLKLTIKPDGRVESCEVVSSELHDPELEKGLVQRVLQFQFEPRDVETITLTKPIDFFPA
jgi:periplasmic protein TonB